MRFLCVIDNDRQGNESKWFVLGWDYEDNAELCNKILQEYFTRYRVMYILKCIQMVE